MTLSTILTVRVSLILTTPNILTREADLTTISPRVKAAIAQAVIFVRLATFVLYLCVQTVAATVVERYEKKKRYRQNGKKDCGVRYSVCAFLRSASYRRNI